ncbi:hypothetical protein QLQ12_30055 [Actinoplanes sp. NEAU-A12]|uniref:Uncharacterized protein n=1 Tax=Actinoplanes sandaracinus TaxID=3045177 RepID=A0ABT6WT26_9ACTN|nr:hypothetical protein [Actinoplanes sandaracinus]MDI6102870.1 hypothetical protein [Actinoplanes sandaracinus]
MTRPMDEIDLETPEADAAEQATTAVPGQDDAGENDDTPEQDRIVEYDDDYR